MGNSSVSVWSGWFGVKDVSKALDLAALLLLYPVEIMSSSYDHLPFGEVQFSGVVNGQNF